jgi:hypothetical protein
MTGSTDIEAGEIHLSASRRLGTINALLLACASFGLATLVAVIVLEQHASRISKGRRVVASVHIWLAGDPRKRIDCKELRCRRIVDACPQVNQARVGTRVLAIEAEWGGRCPFAGRGSVCVVGAFARDGAC